MARLALAIAYLAICVLGANSIAVQRPAEMSRPTPNICKKLVSGTTNLFTTPLLFQQEPRPEGFAVDLKYISKYQDLDKFDVWLSIVSNIARMSLNPWDLGLTGTLSFRVSYNIELNIINSIRLPHYQTKSVAWTLQEVFFEYNRRQQYTSASFVTRVGSVALGFSSFKSTLARSAAREQNNASSPTADAQLSAASIIPATQLGRKGFDFRLDYKPSGARFSDSGFFGIMINFLLLSANRDPKTQPIKKIALTSRAEGYTVEIAAPNQDEDIPLSLIIQILGLLPEKMYQAAPRVGRWSELTGVVKFDGVNIARLGVEKDGVGNASDFTRADGVMMVNDMLVDICPDPSNTTASF